MRYRAGLAESRSLAMTKDWWNEFEDEPVAAPPLVRARELIAAVEEAPQSERVRTLCEEHGEILARVVVRLAREPDVEAASRPDIDGDVEYLECELRDVVADYDELKTRIERDEARTEAVRLHRTLAEVTSTAKEVRAENTPEFMKYLADRCAYAEHVWETTKRSALANGD